MNDVERAFYTLDGWLTGQHVDLGRAHDALEQLRAAVANDAQRIDQLHAWLNEARTDAEKARCERDAATARAEAAEANAQELLNAFSRLQAEHSELIERERVWEKERNDYAQAIISLRETVHIAREAFGEIPAASMREIIDVAKEAYPRGEDGAELRATCGHVEQWLGIVERYKPEEQPHAL